MEPSATPAYPAQPNYYGPAAGQSPTLSVGDWVITLIVSALPLIGIVMLFVWAFSSSTPPSKANWAKAVLIFTLIFMVLGFLFAGSIMAVLMQSAGNRHAY